MALALSIIQLALNALNFLQGVVLVRVFASDPGLNGFYSSYAIFLFLLSVINAPFVQALISFDLEAGKRPPSSRTANWLLFLAIGMIDIAIIAFIYFALNDHQLMFKTDILFLSVAVALTLNAFVLSAMFYSRMFRDGSVFLPSLVPWVQPILVTIAMWLFGKQIGLNIIYLGLLASSVTILSINIFLLGRRNMNRPRIIEYTTTEFSRAFGRSIISVFPLIVPASFFIYSASTFQQDISVVYFTIPISFAGVISTISSYGTFLLKLPSSKNRSGRGSRQGILAAFALSLVLYGVIVVLINPIFELVYGLVPNPAELTIVKIVLISAVFTSILSVIRTSDFAERVDKFSLFVSFLVSLLTIAAIVTLAMNGVSFFIVSGIYSLSYLLIFLIKFARSFADPASVASQ